MRSPWLFVLLLATALAATAAPDRPSVPTVAAVPQADAAVAQGNLDRALRFWDAAYRSALKAYRWEDLVELGDASRRMGAALGRPEPFDARAREAYRAAFSRARLDESVDGVLRVAEGLAALGDRDEVARCLRLAEVLASTDPDAQADVRAFAMRFADLLAPTKRSER
jgi:hypothetical protein